MLSFEISYDFLPGVSAYALKRNISPIGSYSNICQSHYGFLAPSRAYEKVIAIPPHVTESSMYCRKVAVFSQISKAHTKFTLD